MSSAAMNPAAPHHQPAFFTAPGETDILFNVMGIFLVVMVLMVVCFLFQVPCPSGEIAHKGQKVQFEIVAVLGLISLFTHNHIFWIAGLLLAFIPMPDFSTPLTGMANSLAKMAGRGEAPADRRPIRREHGAGANDRERREAARRAIRASCCGVARSSFRRSAARSIQGKGISHA